MTSVKKTKEGVVVNVFKMGNPVPPVKVSPFIKTCRWSFLIFGIFYGFNKKALVRSYEAKERPKREIRLKEKALKRAEEQRKSATAELTVVAREFEILDLPPDWDSDL